MNFKSLCIQTMKNRFLESGIIRSGFLFASVFSLLNSLTSDNHRSPPTYCVWYSQQARENTYSVNLDYVCASWPGSTSLAAALGAGISEGSFPLPLHQLRAHLEKRVTGSSQCGLTKGQPCLADPIAFGNKLALPMRGEQGMSFTLNLAKTSLSPATLLYPS